MVLSQARPATERASRNPEPGPGLPRIAISMAPVLALYVCYTLVRWAAAKRGPVVGPRHAADLLRLERWLDIDFELRLQRIALPHAWVIKAANWYYVAGFLPVLVSCAVLCAWRNAGAFNWWRHVFTISLLLALIGYATFPLSPPRLLPVAEGFVDTLQVYGPHYYGNSHGESLFNAHGALPSLVNLYAAMPSMHVAWSFVAGVLFGLAWRSKRWAAVLAVVHSSCMAAAVVLTANHYVLDVLAGLLALGIAVMLTRSSLPIIGRKPRPEANA
jgi:hypothetical protein